MPGSTTGKYQQDEGDNLYRRSMYTLWKRSAPPASMDIFNAPTREHCTVQRERTNTPLQALVTLNDPQFIESARFLAQKAIEAVGGDLDERLDYITTRVLGRVLESSEREIAKNTYGKFFSYYKANGSEALRLIQVGESIPMELSRPVQSAALTMMANQLLNLDEVLNK